MLRKLYGIRCTLYKTLLPTTREYVADVAVVVYVRLTWSYFLFQINAENLSKPDCLVEYTSIA